MKYTSDFVKKIRKKYTFAEKYQISWSDFIILAKEAAKLYKFPPNVVICQAALECGRGTSYMARTKNNYFGFMAYDSDPGKAKKYETALDSIIDYLELLTTTPRYTAVKKCKTPLETIEAIKTAGYATDPLYVQKITSLKEWTS